MSDDKPKKIMITLKPDIVEELDRMAKEWGTTRSGMVTILTKMRVEHEKERAEKQFDEYILREEILKGKNVDEVKF